MKRCAGLRRHEPSKEIRYQERECFEGETVTVAGYTKQDGLGRPSVIVELPDTLPMGNRGWSPEDGHRLDDRMLLYADPTKSYWYVDIEDLEEC